MKLKTGEYLGKYSTERVINGLLITRSYHLQFNTIAWHHHSNPYYSFVLEGKYQEHYNKETVSLKKGDVVFHPSHTVHSNVFQNLATTCLNIEFSNEWFRYFELDPASIREQPLINDSIQKVLVNKLAREIGDPDEFSDMSILGIAAELTRSMIKEPERRKPVPSFLWKLKLYIDQHYSSNPDLHSLSQLANVSAEHICREFKNKFGVTLGDYIRHKKISKACELLSKKSAAIEQIAFELGFADAPHFNKVFKKVTGFSPSVYRSSL